MKRPPLILLFLAVIAVASCATAKIPAAVKPTAVCLYNEVKATPGIKRLDVFVVQKNTLIVYYYDDPSFGSEMLRFLHVSPSRFNIEYMENDPLNKVFNELIDHCNVDVGRHSQFFFTKRSQWVDMTKE